TNQTAVMIASKEAGETYPVRVIEWRAAEGHPRTVRTHLPLRAVLEATVREELMGEPVSPTDPLTPLLVLPEDGLVASRAIRRASWYADHVRKGVDSRGANG